ncbi:minor capsid protein [Leuconostoc pseudomesenteroides]|uniref:minor capsid protein n=1 Tax=Leuconostoc pseudomesenteroides TaxID=33968 RepID=UPI00403E1756
MGDLSVTVKVDIGNIEKRFSSSSTSRARFAMANQMLTDMDKLVPKKRGNLRASGHVTGHGSSLTWDTPYARAQFYGMVGRAPGHRVRNYTTSGTNRRWDLIGKGRYMKSWQTIFKGALK